MSDEYDTAHAAARNAHGCAPDFSVVVEALKRHARETGQTPLSISGWEAEDEGIGPPEPLIASLEAVSTGIYGHTYLRELREPKARAAALFHHGLRLGGATLTAECVAILPNSTQALLLTLAALRDQDIERVVVAAPVYFSAVEVCRRLGLATTIIPAANYLTGALNLDALIR
jgi:aspartate/methionine/tyrosine aminotransferase